MDETGDPGAMQMSLLQKELRVSRNTLPGFPAADTMDSTAEKAKAIAEEWTRDMKSPIRVQKDVPVEHEFAELPYASMGCACNHLRMLFHEDETEAHLSRLVTDTYYQAGQTGSSKDKAVQFHFMAAAANRYYLEACNGEEDLSCKNDVAQASFYNSKLSAIHHLRDIASSNKFEVAVKDALQGKDAGCSCDPASIAMHRVWAVGGTGAFYSDASNAYLDYCNNVTAAACPCDPIEAEFHYFGSQANSGYNPGTDDPDAPANGHRAYWDHCPNARVPNQKLYQDLLVKLLLEAFSRSPALLR